MTENKRFTVKPQDNYFGVTDNLTEDKVNVVNGIRTEIEAKWLCDLLNELDEKWIGEFSLRETLQLELERVEKENEQLKQGMDKLFDYFAKWFEEERGVYIEDFIELWKSIQKGDVE